MFSLGWFTHRILSSNHLACAAISKFFHAMASARRPRNAIVKLTCEDGTVADSQVALGEVGA